MKSHSVSFFFCLKGFPEKRNVKIIGEETGYNKVSTSYEMLSSFIIMKKITFLNRTEGFRKPKLNFSIMKNSHANLQKKKSTIISARLRQKNPNLT